MLCISLPIAGLILDKSQLGFNDSFLLRLILSGIFLILFIGSFTVRFIQEKHIIISRISLYVLTAYFFGLTFVNDLFPFYYVTSGIIIAASPVFFLEWKRFFPYLIFNLCIGLAILFVFSDQSKNLILFFLIEGFALVMATIGLIVLQNFTSSLRFSDQLINNVDALVLASNPEGEITFVSENVTHILGYKRKEILGMGWWMIRNNLDDEADLSGYAASMKKKHAADGGGYDAPVTTADGREKWFHWRIVDIGDDYSVGIGQDITEQKKAKEEAKKLSLIAQNTDNIVLLTDDQDKVEWVNPAFEKLTGFSLHEIKGKEPSRFITGKGTDLALLNEKTRLAYIEKKVQYGEFLFFKKSGEAFWSSLNFTPVKDELGNAIRLIAIGRDVTTEKNDKEKIKIYSERLKVLHDLDRNIFVANTLEEVFQGVLENIHQISISLNRISISIFNKDENYVRVLSRNEGDESENWKNLVKPIKDFNNLIEVFKDAQYLLNNLQEAKDKDLTNFHREVLQLGVNAYISIPIRYDNKLIGSINFGAVSIDVFSQDNIDFLLELTTDVSSAVYQTQLKETIRKKNDKIQQRNKDISDSIRYAMRIQDAIFPNKSLINKHFKDNLIYFKPKEELSGDFYFMEEDGDNLWFAAVDCTGHGIPGALVSIVGHNILLEAIREKNINKPSQVLSYLNTKLISRMSNDEEDLKDGLDISLCRYDLKNRELVYAGVMNDLIRLRDGERSFYRANRQPLGIINDRPADDFNEQIIDIQEGDKIYLFSDGFADQFGGSADKKFGRRRFRELIDEVSTYPMKEQYRIIDNSLMVWMKDKEQIDDILIFGLQF